MKKQENNTLHITAYCFKVLLEKVLQHFQEKYSDTSLNRITQLYGFGNYDSSQPNLTTELGKLTGGFINGKYLYDKSRELQSGKPRLKLNGYYKEVLFRYIGYDDIEAFTRHEITDKAEQNKQLALINNNQTTSDYYYVSYHFGEHKEVVKGQVTILNGWKNVKYKYIYVQKDGSVKEFQYHGVMIKRADIIHIKTKTLMGDKMVDGGEDILYAGHTEAGSSAFMIGTFSAFDIYNKVIAGKLIFEKCATKEEMIERSTSKKTPAYIVQEIRNQRIANRGIVPNDVMEISAKSPYSITYEKVAGRYKLFFFQKDNHLGSFEYSVDPQTFKIRPMTEGVVIKHDNFEIINNGSVIHFSFQITGIALFSRLEVFFKTYYLNRGDKDIQGVFSGLDIENCLISGDVKIIFEP